jgi:5S rRNA maturation endonuclease (ribonuclease M5)
MCTKCLSQKLKEINILVDLDEDGKIILTDLKEIGLKEWTVFFVEFSTF